RALHAQTARLLTKGAKFEQAVGYDNENYSRLVGSVPAEEIDKLLEDVRNLPGGKEVAILRRVSPIRLVVVRPDLPVPAPAPKLTDVPAAQAKFSPDLRQLLASPAANTATRLQVILGYTPKDTDKTWLRAIDTDGLTIEGRLGPIVTVHGV